MFVFKAPYTVRCFGSCACNYSIHEAEEELFQATLGCIIYEILSYTEKHQTDSIFHLLIYIYIYMITCMANQFEMLLKLEDIKCIIMGGPLCRDYLQKWKRGLLNA